MTKQAYEEERDMRYKALGSKALKEDILAALVAFYGEGYLDVLLATRDEIGRDLVNVAAKIERHNKESRK